MLTNDNAIIHYQKYQINICLHGNLSSKIVNGFCKFKSSSKIIEVVNIRALSSLFGVKSICFKNIINYQKLRQLN